MINKKWIVSSCIVAIIAISSYTISRSSAEAEQTSSTSEHLVIKDKMLNAIDHYTTAKGTYLYRSSAGSIEQINFDVRQGSNPGSHIQISNEQGIVHKTGTASGGQILITSEKDKSYKLASISQNPNPPTAEREQNKDGKAYYIYRNDPAAPIDAGNVTFPQALAFWLKDGKYKIVGHETYLNRDATVIEGDVLPEKRSAGKTFKMWVDSKTGILLHFLVNSDSSKPAMEIKVLDIEIDEADRNEAFDLTPPESYTNKSNKSVS
ncbi:hypothetical protein [Paenibacillus sp. GCM10012303]|jgi:outer membrane lipoprotein-sorting protein|uniref:hypothetical protein n=1 Tax=Paenibacillus sp. GCM10012303 TaxID=3317340 RepID=UPI00360B56BF